MLDSCVVPEGRWEPGCEPGFIVVSVGLCRICLQLEALSGHREQQRSCLEKQNKACLKQKFKHVQTEIVWFPKECSQV